jgi:hypothetical protein
MVEMKLITSLKKMAFFDKVNGNKCIVANVMREENIATTKKMNNNKIYSRVFVGYPRVGSGRVMKFEICATVARVRVPETRPMQGSNYYS